jgi:sortase (surface protein transpeptidase)
VAPVELKIPALGVDADVVPVGLDDDGAMTAPSDPDTVAWYEPGPGTGMPGNVVLAGHVDWGGRLRVFGLLYRLGPGDRIVVIDEQLREFFYEVAWSRWVAAEGAPVEEIFAGTELSELTLITCGGAFDHASRQYLDRLIVRAVKV